MTIDAISPYELQVFGGLFAAVAEEMGVALMRSSFSPNIKERRDFSCAVFDRDGLMIAHAAHIPVHLGSSTPSVAAARRRGTMRSGDMIILNDPFDGGTHLPDITLVAPVCLGSSKEPSFYLLNRAHHSDVGGMAPGSMAPARESCQEGLRLPPVCLVEGGVLNGDLMSIILANVRTPNERRSDLSAQIAANRRGIARIEALCERYSEKRLALSAKSLLDYGERSMRSLITKIPRGAYECEDVIESDGTGARPISIRLRLEVGRRSIVADFSKSDPQSEGAMNANLAITRSAVLYVFRALAGGDIPANDGSLRPIDIKTRPGSVVDAKWPAAVAGGNVETSQRLVDVLLGALSKASPELVPALSQGTMNNVTLGGKRSDGTPFTYYETLGGGAGGSAYGRGASGIHSHMTNTLNTPIESLENEFPFRVVQNTLKRQSGGRGKFDGGDSLVRELEVLEPTSITLLTERREFPPRGANGGDDGALGLNRVCRHGVWEKVPSKFQGRLEPGDRLQIETPSGGGYGENNEGVDL